VRLLRLVKLGERRLQLLFGIGGQHVGVKMIVLPSAVAQAKLQRFKQLLSGRDAAHFERGLDRVFRQAAAKNDGIAPQRLHGQRRQRPAPVTEVGAAVLIVVSLATGAKQQQERRQRHHADSAANLFSSHEKLLFLKTGEHWL